MNVSKIKLFGKQKNEMSVVLKQFTNQTPPKSKTCCHVVAKLHLLHIDKTTFVILVELSKYMQIKVGYFSYFWSLVEVEKLTKPLVYKTKYNIYFTKGSSEGKTLF